MTLRIQPSPGSPSKWPLRGWLAAGALALLYFYSWWLEDGRLQSPLLVAMLALALAYGVCQMAASWWLYLCARRPPEFPPLNGLSVDVFVPACGEDFELVERCLTAACSMHGAHQTWLLDDGQDPRLAQLARRLGAGYLTRSNRKDFKAGNLNAALARTCGEIVVIFDIDHIPAPNFLERTLGYFADPQVGFVQVMVTFRNLAESWVSRAAIETSLDYYNPTSLGADYYRSATLMGSNALIRRSALEQIGGYQPGLAEDLATSLALHAAGWSSRYVAEPLAPGLAPPDLAAWLVQQLKWARGVFELLLTALPARFKKLTTGARLSYAVRMTSYWLGPVAAGHLVVTLAILFLGNATLQQAAGSYLAHLAPLVICFVIIRATALRTFRHPSVQGLSFFDAVILIYGTWPVYSLAWLMALLRLPLSFRPTPKSSSGQLNLLWLLPQALTAALLLAGSAWAAWRSSQPAAALAGFALLQAGLHLSFLRYAAAPIFRPARVTEISAGAPPSDGTA